MNENTQVKRRTTRRLRTLDVQLKSTRLTQATAFHNLCRDQHEISAPHLVCARSGYLHTICSDVTQRKGLHHYISDCRLTILGRPDNSCRSHARNSTSFAMRFHAESGSGHLLVMLELIFHWTSDQWDSQTVHPTTPSRSQWPFTHRSRTSRSTFQISTRKSFAASR